MHSLISGDLIEDLQETNEDKVIDQICEDIRNELPRNATLPSESIVFPESGEVRKITSVSSGNR